MPGSSGQRERACTSVVGVGSSVAAVAVRHVLSGVRRAETVDGGAAGDFLTGRAKWVQRTDSGLCVVGREADRLVGWVETRRGTWAGLLGWFSGESSRPSLFQPKS